MTLRPFPPEGRADPGSGAAAPATASSVNPAVRVASDWTWRLLVIALGLVGIVRLLAGFADILVPILVSLLLAALLHPLVGLITRARVPRPVAALACVLLTLLLVAALFTLVGQQTARGFSDLRTQAVAGASDLQQRLADGPLHLSSTALSDAVRRAEASASSNRGALLSGALGVASTATKIAEGLFITLFSTFFFLSSGHRIWAWLLRLLPAGAREPLDEAGRSGWVTLSYYVRATLVVAVVDGLGVGIGAALLGVPLAVPLGVVVFLGAFIPVVGALLSGILAVLVALVAQGPFIALLMLGVVLVVQQVEAHGLQPFLLGRAVAVHPLAVILSIATGAAVAGIAGALFVVPLVAVGNTMITSVAGRGRSDPGRQLAAEHAPLSPTRPGATIAEHPDDASPAQPAPEPSAV